MDNLEKTAQRLEANINATELLIKKAKASGNRIEEQRRKRELKALNRQLNDLGKTI